MVLGEGFSILCLFIPVGVISAFLHAVAIYITTCCLAVNSRGNDKLPLPDKDPVGGETLHPVD